MEKIKEITKIGLVVISIALSGVVYYGYHELKSNFGVMVVSQVKVPSVTSLVVKKLEQLINKNIPYKKPMMELL